MGAAAAGRESAQTEKTAKIRALAFAQRAAADAAGNLPQRNGAGGMKPARFEAEAAKMREKYQMIPENEKTALDYEEAFRAGYNAGVGGLVGSRDQCPLHHPPLRKRWRDGFDLGAGKGLRIALPKMAGRR
jgi:ribosome modulation factor